MKEIPNVIVDDVIENSCTVIRQVAWFLIRFEGPAIKSRSWLNVYNCADTVSGSISNRLIVIAD